MRDAITGAVGNRWLAFRLAILAAVALSAAAHAAPSDAVVVNGVALDAKTVQALEHYYRTPIRPGRYWYDGFSGAWGYEGGPIAGQIAAGLKLGGPLRADAARGTSGVFVNGRELALVEVRGLQQACRTPVVRGRYWVDAQGVGGNEGGPPRFNLALCGPHGGGRSGGSSSRTYCDAGGNCSTHGLWGWVATTH